MWVMVAVIIWLVVLLARLLWVVNKLDRCDQCGDWRPVGARCLTCFFEGVQ